MKDLSWLKETKLAHRGLHEKDLSIPENSIAAFENAMSHGYGLELDLNILKDDTVIVFHDHHLKRMTGLDQYVSSSTYEDIKSLTLNDTDSHIPTFDELLRLVNGRVPLLIEIKPFGDIDHFCSLVYNRLKAYQGTYAIFSFHPKVVKWFKRNAPEVIRGQIATKYHKSEAVNPFIGLLLGRLFFNRFTKPDFISYNVKHMPNKYLDKAKKRGVTIISYVARDQKTYDFVKKHYDNIVFEFFTPE